MGKRTGNSSWAATEIRSRGRRKSFRHGAVVRSVTARSHLRISVIFGTRPEAIKLAPVVLACRESAGLDCRVCVTGQHREMLEQVLPVFGVRPDVDLALMRPGQTLAGLTARLMEALDGYLEADRPDLVLVQGDTTTVFCAALAAFYRRIPVGHVEAGLRTGNLDAPWPEEANRVLTTRLTRLHFAPTTAAAENLRREGVAEAHVFVTGNTVIDALRLAVARVRADPPVVPGLPPELQPVAGRAAAARPRFVLITGHRRENFGDGFESICQAIAELAGRFPEVHFVYPVHLNPRVREPVERILRPLGSTAGGAAARANVHLLEPLSYLPFVALMDAASLILTDSGGVQEEAPSLGRPVLVMRETTERPEALATGLVRLVGTDRDRIVRGVAAGLAAPSPATMNGLLPSPYGDGQSARRIVEHCRDFLLPRAAVA